MKTEELRLGNWIKISVDAREYKIIGIDGSYHGAKPTVEIWGGARDYEKHPESKIRGIPLTKEWLIRFGFEQGDNVECNHSFYWKAIGVSALTINPDNGVVWIGALRKEFNNHYDYKRTNRGGVRR